VIIVAAIVLVAGSLVSYFVITNNNCTAAKMVIEGGAMSLVLDLVLTILMSALFINKMKQVSGVRKMGKEVHEADIKIEKITRKLTILTCVSVVSTVVLYLLYFVVETIEAITELLVSSILLVMSFKVYDKWYLCCCNPCEKYCKLS